MLADVILPSSSMTGGYLHIDEILQLPQFASFCHNDIRRIVLNDKKGRYQFRLSSSSRPQVRATQGHSVEVENMGLREIHDPSAYPTVVHGTYFKNWASIRRQGLSRMSRTHIHFARGDPGANDVISGMRASAEVMIYIDLALAMRGKCPDVDWSQSLVSGDVLSLLKSSKLEILKLTQYS